MVEVKEGVMAKTGSESFIINIHYQPAKEFFEQASWLQNIWYGKFIRGYIKTGNPCDIYINKDAWYKDKDDLNRLILHEIGHQLGMEHTKAPGGIMFFSGLLRW